MHSLLVIFLGLLFAGAPDAPVAPAGLTVGADAVAFSLKNIDGKTVALADYASSKGVILVFTCNHCPYAKKYEDRIVALDKTAKAQGYPVVAINPNDATAYPEDSFDNMKVRAKEKGFTFPYLHDESQAIAKAYGAAKTPHVYLLQREGQGASAKFVVRYIGAIDNDTEGTNVTTRYVEAAIAELQAGKAVSTTETKAIGCSIKWKKSAQ